MTQEERRAYLINKLLNEQPAYAKIEIPHSSGEQKTLLRALFNVRMPAPVDAEFLQVQDAYLEEELRHRGVTDADALPEVQPGIAIWQGDISTLRCDAIVNAANSGMTGCYVPNHRCIDNCIHTFAGVQLRFDCDKLMKIQGMPESTGKAKITKAYNLPCRYILHTVGPIISGPLTKRECELLASCYRSCLQLAAEYELESVAFCCISTGEFHFPNQRAAEIAVETVRAFLKTETSIKKVIFNVFKDIDKEIYERLLAGA